MIVRIICLPFFTGYKKCRSSLIQNEINLEEFLSYKQPIKSTRSTLIIDNPGEVFVPTTEIQAESYLDSEEIVVPTTEIQAESHPDSEVVVLTTEIQAEPHPDSEEVVVPTTEIQVESHPDESSKSDESQEGVSELSTDSGISKDLERSILSQENSKEEIKHAAIKSQPSLDDSFIDIDMNTVNGTISAVVKEHIPTTSDVHENDSEQIKTPVKETSTPRFEGEEDDDLDATPVLDTGHIVSDDEESELLRSLDKTSKKNVEQFTNSSMEMARENLIMINPEEERTDSSIDNESFYSVRSDITITDTDNTSFMTATDRLTPTQDLSVSVPDLTVTSHGGSKNGISKSTSSLKNRRSLSSSKFEIQFIDEKTNRVMSRESLTASFDASAATNTSQLTKQQKRLSGPPKSPGKETSV